MFEDETGFTLHPRLGRVWAKKGERVRIPTTSHHSRRINIFGWVAPLLGRNGLVKMPKGNRDGFLSCLKHLYRTLKRHTIWLYVDRAKWHSGEKIEIFLKAHRRLRLEYLPPYQPGLNPQERLWRQMRYETTTNYWFETLDEVWMSIRKTNRAWTPDKIKRICHIT